MTDVRRSRLMETIGLDNLKYKVVSATIDSVVVKNLKTNKTAHIRY